MTRNGTDFPSTITSSAAKKALRSGRKRPRCTSEAAASFDRNRFVARSKHDSRRLDVERAFALRSEKKLVQREPRRLAHAFAHLVNQRLERRIGFAPRLVRVGAKHENTEDILHGDGRRVAMEHP